MRNVHSYLYGQEIVHRTENAAVSSMRSLKTPSGQMARWLQEISTCNLIVTHRPGRKHGNADALSRKPCQACLHQQKLNETSLDCSINQEEDVTDSYVDPKHTVLATTRNQEKQKQKQNSL